MEESQVHTRRAYKFSPRGSKMAKNVLTRLMELAESLDQPIGIGDLWIELFPEEWTILRHILHVMKNVGADAQESETRTTISFNPDHIIKTGLVLMAENGLRFCTLYTQDQVKQRLRDYLLSKNHDCADYVGDWLRIGLSRIQVRRDGFDFDSNDDPHLVRLLLDTVSFAKEELGGVEEGIPIMQAFQGEA